VDNFLCALIIIGQAREYTVEVFVKKYVLLSSLIIVLVLSACGASDEDPTEVSPEPTKEGVLALPTVEPSLNLPGYPEPSDPGAYPGPEEPAGYPAPPIMTAAPAAYPEGTTFWMDHSAGLQCEEPLTYPTIDDALAALEEKGVIALKSESFGMAVCEACGCPTSQHYRVNIDANDLDKAITLGWNRE
jgi:hypothetical protein